MKLVRNFEYIELPIKRTLGHLAVVRKDGSDLKPSEYSVVGNMIFEYSRRAVNGFQEQRRLLGTVLNDCDRGSIFDDCQKHQSLEFSFEHYSPLR